MGSYSLSHHGSWKHQLLKHCVSAYVQKMCTFKALVGGGGFHKHTHSCNCFPHTKFMLCGFAQRAMITPTNHCIGLESLYFLLIYNYIDNVEHHLCPEI
jgi:hypothetical protein